ncbi:MAG: PEP-CTERM sorting domain-containing protein [Phycisphaerae bacterium]|nr:PEP-CTERM sorting domain-containing protein [Phycisphaerae bacterium]
MKTLLLNRVVWVTLVAVAVTGQAMGITVPHEPLAQVGYYRPLRSDYVRSWYIFKDTTGEGILNPGDTYVEQLNNWWTPVSSGSQGLYNDNPAATGTELSSAAQNWATYTLAGDHPDKDNPNYNYWLPQESGTIGFYMSYSQFDNCAWHDPAFAPGSNPTQRQIMREMHAGRNGWTLGWVINEINPAGAGSPAGFVNMDVAVHNGKLDTNVPGWGQSISNPRATMSNDLDAVLSLMNSLDYKTRHPALFDDAVGDHTWAANATRMLAEGYDATDLAMLVASQELKEIPGFNTGLLDHAGDPYLYEDAFNERSVYSQGTTDGGVIGGLSGFNGLDPEWSNWGDQQVIRIEISADTLMLGGITELRFFDFGTSVPGSTTSDQVNPRMIVFNADPSGHLYFDDPNVGPIYFPDNRIFIAVTVPEPASLCLLTLGAGAIVFLRRRRTA